MVGVRSEEHTSELQSRQYLHSVPTRRSSDLGRNRARRGVSRVRSGELCDRRDHSHGWRCRSGDLSGTLRVFSHDRLVQVRALIGTIAAAMSELRTWWVLDRKSTRLNSSHANISTLSLHDALPISEEIARVAVFLASDQASYVTGAIIPMDGGAGAVI